MPCSDSQVGWGFDRYAEEANALRTRLDTVTKMLCGLCEEVDRASIAAVPRLAHWWAEHQAADERRKEQEKRAADDLRRKSHRAAAGLAKLTPEEREALGL